MTDEVDSPNRAITQSLGTLSVEYSRLDARLAYAFLFLTSDSMSLSDETHESEMLRLLSCSMFGQRLRNLKTLINKIELGDETREGWRNLIVRLGRISTHRNDLLHGVWQGSPEGLGNVVRLRPGASRPIEIQRWTSERIRCLYEAINKEMYVIDGALLRPEITVFRNAKDWRPYPVLSESAKATVKAFGDTPLPLVNESLDQVEMLAPK